MNDANEWSCNVDEMEEELNVGGCDGGYECDDEWRTKGG
jgi:hypothetical protein